MKNSKVTDYMLNYMEKNKISIDQISEKTGISKEKLTKDYTEPLLAEEFLELCVALQLSPEKVRHEINLKKNE